MKLSKEHAKYLRGLNLENFDVIRILPQNKNVAAIIMRSKHPDCEKLWCVEYRGNGHYFDTYAESLDYCTARKWA